MVKYGLFMILFIAMCGTASSSAWLGRYADAPKPAATEDTLPVGTWFPIHLRTSSLTETTPKSPKDKSRTDLPSRIGKLKLVGGLVLTSHDDRFGGFSGLRLSQDGSSLLSVSDRGHWFKTEISLNDTGNITDLTEPHFATMMRSTGEKLKNMGADAEGIALVENGAIVSFERYHRLDAYQLEQDGRYTYRQRILHNPLVKNLPGNGGMEGVVHLRDGRVLAFGEKTIGNDPTSEQVFLSPRDTPAWVSSSKNWPHGGDDWRALGYTPYPEFSVTDVTQDKSKAGNGDLYLIERAYSNVKGVRARIIRLKEADIQPGKIVSGELVAFLTMLNGIDNMEGIDVRRRDDGTLMLYLISDDNFSSSQRTVLMSFEITEE